MKIIDNLVRIRVTVARTSGFAVSPAVSGSRIQRIYLCYEFGSNLSGNLAKVRLKL